MAPESHRNPNLKAHSICDDFHTLKEFALLEAGKMLLAFSCWVCPRFSAVQTGVVQSAGGTVTHDMTIAENSTEDRRGESQDSGASTMRRIWIDLDNSPHVPFFAPIIRALQARGYSVLLTARDAYQTRDMLALHGLNCRCIGGHYGKHRLLKILGTLMRAVQLAPLILRHRPDLAVGHGSRAQLILSAVLRVPTLHIGDYEHAKVWAFIHPTWALVPEVIPADALDEDPDRVLKYPGIKEDVYVPSFAPNPEILTQLGVPPGDIVVTVRPPASEAHYHNSQSDELFAATMELLGQHPEVKIVVLPRNERQTAAVRQHWSHLLESGKAVIPPKVVDGLNLIWFSDLVISGGGTMNREAAALGVPVYSIFRGKTGAVDRYLSQTGRLVMLETVEDVRRQIALIHRNRQATPDSTPRPALESIVSHIVLAVTRAREAAAAGAN
jgi:predicted glycosyltransferase